MNGTAEPEVAVCGRGGPPDIPDGRDEVSVAVTGRGEAPIARYGRDEVSVAVEVSGTRRRQWPGPPAVAVVVPREASPGELGMVS